MPSDNRAYAAITGFGQVVTPGEPNVALSDDFPGASVDTGKWNVASTAHAGVSVASGQLQMTISNVPPQQASAQSADSYDITNGGWVRVRLAAVASDAQCVTELLIPGVSDTGWEAGGGYPFVPAFRVSDSGTLIALGSSGPLKGASWDAEAMKWIRLRVWAGVLYYETSPDGDAWEVFTTGAPPVSAVLPVLRLSSLFDGDHPFTSHSGASAFAGFALAYTTPNPPIPEVTAKAIVVSPDSSAVSVSDISVPFAYDDYPNEAVIEATRDAAGDPDLEVTIL